MNSKAKVEVVFQTEFGIIADKFKLIDLQVADLLKSKDEFVWNPGVYVFYKGIDVIKVGRHLVNSRKRAWEHIVDNTQNGDLMMKDLQHDPNARVLLINVKDSNDFHWVAAVEIFLEARLAPLIRSKRLG
jgi:hypothetical protein